MREFKLPDLGEGLTEGEILQWMVAPGDTVTLNQPIVEVETAKAAVEVPSPFAGVVTQIHHDAGATVDVGSVIISFDTDPSAGPLEPAGRAGETAEAGEAGEAAAGNAAAGAAANPVESAAAKDTSAVGSRADLEADTLPAGVADAVESDGALIGEVGPTGRTATLVGYGPKSVTAKRRPRSTDAPSRGGATPPAAATPVASATPPPAPARESAAQVGQAAASRSAGTDVLCKPPVRKLAKDLGVDLTSLAGTGPGGAITRADVESAAGSARPEAPSPASAGRSASVGADDDPATRERRIPVKGVRKHTAAAMVASAFSAPHVTEFITLDMTPTMELRPRIAALPEFAGVKVTPLLFVAKALLLATARNPEINSTWDDDAQEIVVKDYVHLGIAAATPRGLVVPNVKDADQLSLPELAAALQGLTETAKQGKTQPADMSGGTITITNVGVFGVDNGTPILNPGESAILCFGAVRPTPWVHDGEIAVRQVTQLSLSFDHRNVDGALGSRFLSDVARVLSDPTTALAWA